MIEQGGKKHYLDGRLLRKARTNSDWRTQNNYGKRQRQEICIDALPRKLLESLRAGLDTEFSLFPFRYFNISASGLPSFNSSDNEYSYMSSQDKKNEDIS